MVTARYLVVTGRYLVVTSGYCSLLVVTGRSHFLHERQFTIKVRGLFQTLPDCLAV